jgi:putative NIF3 family GTP cyclohydrolase 1 type 2
MNMDLLPRKNTACHTLSEFRGGRKVKFKEMYELAVAKGIEADPRAKPEVEHALAEVRQAYDDLKEKEKEEFDPDRFWNPYDDTRILYGDPGAEITSILVGIDMEIGEVMLADRLNEKGVRIDAVVAHHPEGAALAKLHGVMHLQEDILHSLGVPVNIAEGIMADRIKEVERLLMPVNHNKAIDAARILGIPMMCMHTPADNNVFRYLNELFSNASPRRVKDVVEMLKEVPEYAKASKNAAGPKVIAGLPERRAGKVFIDMTGGTSGSEAAYEQLADAGVGTIVCMHMKDEHRKKAEKYHLNVVIAGHIASDSLGMNLILDAFEARGVQTTACSGLIRYKRLN